MRHAENEALNQDETWSTHETAQRPPRRMDVVRDVPQQSRLRKYWYVPAALAVLLAAFGVKHWVGGAGYIARRSDLTISTVRQGDFAVNVRANGKLKSKDVLFLASRVSGSVAQILAKPGDTVDVDTPIVTLVNPQLTVDLMQGRAKLRQITAERLVELKTLESALLDQQVQLLSATNAYQTAVRDLNTKTELSKYDEGLVSAVDYQQTKASVETQRQIVELSKRRVTEMYARVQAQKVAQNLEIEQLQESVNNVQTQIDQLVVRAGMKGMLQSLAVSPGQKLDVGDSVGVVADSTHLIAQLQVPELQVQRVANGLPVTIDTRRSKIEGRVIRIAPAVQGGMVDVDVALDENATLPVEARADLSVEGMVHILGLKNVLYMDRPDFAKAGTTQNFYRLDDDESRATRVPVQLGEASVNQIQIVQGLQPGDKVITSDASAFATHAEIMVK